MLKVKEVAAQLNVSVDTVKRLLRDGEIPFYRVGTQLRVDPKDLAAYLEKVRYAGSTDERMQKIKPRPTYTPFQKVV